MTKDNSTATSVIRFQQWGTAALVAVFLVILAGAVVRSTGAGMGCPDWPRCFGLWVPPTHESQLPHDYQQRFNLHGHGVEPFNALKTWTEYVNRLIGAATGLVVLLFVFHGTRIRSIHPTPFWLAFAGFVLIAFQGWLGKKVVDSNLAEGMITVHMLLAIVILLILASAAWLVSTPTLPPDQDDLARKITYLAMVALMLTFVQVGLGTRIREMVDANARSLAYAHRETWIPQSSAWFLIHRSMSILALVLNAGILYYSRRVYGRLRWTDWVLGSIILLQIALGAVLSYADLPWLAQPFHLLLGIALCLLQFYYVLPALQQYGQSKVA